MTMPEKIWAVASATGACVVGFSKPSLDYKHLYVLAPVTLEEGLHDYAMFGKYVAELHRAGFDDTHKGAFIKDWINRVEATWPEFVLFVKVELGIS